ncbi:MAG TPA: hypothetical protein VL285_18510 [Bryobacteraceae bacterium]|jgi:hypothetical protein|nr:hypothetical protein [Bryobacteraceae bacterium]
MEQPFYLGLNMAGTVSAGAYTAGVMDFLIEAMDQWHVERQRQRDQFGAQYDRWTIPPHQLQLAVMAGASGGGITAALTGAALSQPFAHVHAQSPGPFDRNNTLFRSWVTDIDLRPLLGDADLNRESDKLVSLLDSTSIRRIAADALAVTAPLPGVRPWVRDPLKLILTLTNLAGIPYAIEPQTSSDAARTLYHADRREFAITWTRIPGSGESISLDAAGGPGWAALADTAVATAAFPVVLAPQLLARTAGDYNHRLWRIPQNEPAAADGNCICEKLEQMPPAWEARNTDGAPVTTLNVDGGATNNSPFECARLALADLPPRQISGHNQRSPALADRAVVSIAPLSSPTGASIPAPPERRLTTLAGQFIQVLVAQSRNQGENLRLTSDPAVASRWVIAPATHEPGTEPLAGALLGAFGGFVAQRFREHDYQLGRRNCQRFLTRYFGVPWDNVIMRQYQLPETAQRQMDAAYGFDAEKARPGDPDVRCFPLIPVLPSLRSEITAVKNPISEDELHDLGSLGVDRLKLVTKKALEAEGITALLINAGFFLFKGRIRNALVAYAGKEFRRQGFLK